LCALIGVPWRGVSFSTLSMDLREALSQAALRGDERTRACAEARLRRDRRPADRIVGVAYYSGQISYTDLHRPTQTYTDLHTYTPTHTYTHLHTPTQTYTHLHTPTHTYTHLHTPTHTTHLHLHTPAHAYAWSCTTR